MTKTLWKSLCESDTLEIFVNTSEHRGEPRVVTHLTKFKSNFKNHFTELTR